MGSVPEGIIAFLDSSDYESAVRKVVSLGGDSDTLACIAGSIAEAYYKKIPPLIQIETEDRLPGLLWKILENF
jgi:ADP-ribosyl-[dinitrogen reductase] hydrolase